MTKQSTSLLPRAALLQGREMAARQIKPEGLININLASQILGVSPVTIRRRVADGSLPHFRINGRLQFKSSELNAFIEAHRGGFGG